MIARPKKNTLRIFFLFFLLSSLPLFASPVITPPPQPLSGPGGKAYVYKKVEKLFVRTPSGGAWIFSPSLPLPKGSPPLVVFVHGWGSVVPAYGAWIDHLVKRGNIVIYPLWQRSLLTPYWEFTSNLMEGLKGALKKLKTFPYKVNIDKMVLVGHSAGGQLSANLAALAAKEKLPKPVALMSVQPGRKSRWIPLPVKLFSADLSQIPSDILMLVVQGEDDQIVFAKDGKGIFYEATKVPLKNKDYIILPSDDHGTPPLLSDHYAPCSYHRDYSLLVFPPYQKNSLVRFLKKEMQSRLSYSKKERLFVDPLDYYGCWKLLDGLIDGTCHGKNLKYALGNTKEQRYMGLWSDGTPVKELVVTKNP